MKVLAISTLCLVFLFVLLPVQQDEPPPAPCLTNGLFLINAANPVAMQAALGRITAEGGCTIHIFPPDAVIGGLPIEAEATLVAEGVILHVERDFADVGDFPGYPDITDTARQAALAWNSLFVTPEPIIEPPPGALPLVGDQRQVEIPILRGAVATGSPPAPPAPGTYDVSSFMNGKVAVGVIYPESTGSGENWTQARKDQVLGKIQAGLNWYATSYPNANLSFYYTVSTQSTTYEPIALSSAFDYLWINEIMGNMGYNQTYWYDRAHAYINYLRSTNLTDWGVVVFVVDSWNDGDGMFSDNFFAYSTSLTGYNGFQVVMTYDNDSYGIASMNHVMAHEFGHTFGAGDEYCSPGYACCWGNTVEGYLGVQNTGCEAKCDKNSNGVCDGNDSTPGSSCHACPTCVQPTCLMRTGSLTSGLCTTSQAQMGLRDTDGDTRYDPVDTFPAFTYTIDPPVYNNTTTLTWVGVAADTPWASTNRTPVSINNITRVQIQVDGSSFTNCTASDGIFNTPSEDFTCTLTGLASGLHIINIRATNRANNTTTWNDTAIIDTIPPSNPTNLIPGCPATNATWQNICPDALFTWSGATDNLSGVAGYFYYWGPSASGQGTSYTPAAVYDPLPVANPSDTYLRVQAVDNAGNLAPWITLFNLKYDAVAPVLPGLTSPSHTSGAWSTDATVDVTWSGAFDGGGSGVNGYSILWSPAAGGLPDMIQDTSLTYTTSLPLADAQPWYFSLRVQDNVGNWSPAAQIGPFQIDTLPPSLPVITSPSHTAAAWSKDPTIDVTWSGANDGSGSGVSGYSTLWSQVPGALPDIVQDTITTSGSSAQLSDGQSWYMALRVQDMVGNWSAEAAQAGPYWVDTIPPTVTLEIGQAHPSALDVQETATFASYAGCGQSSYLLLNWSGSDAGSGVASYDLQYLPAGGEWTDWLMDNGLLQAQFGPSSPIVPQSGLLYRFRLRARDQVGNISDYPADTDTPGAIIQAFCRILLPVMFR